MISLNYREQRPICEQVKDGLRHLMVTGAIRAGDRLPPVRALAASLAINPNTIRRAYEGLEAEGFFRAEAGSFFAADQGDIHDTRWAELLQQFDAAAAELLFLGLTPAELAMRIQEVRT